MIRHVVTFPNNMPYEAVQQIREQLSAAANDREWRDVVLTNGGTIQDLRPKAHIPAIVRRARALHR